MQLVEQRAVALAHGLDDAGQKRLGPVGSPFEQAAQNVLGHAALELLARHARRVEVGAALLLAHEQTLLEEAVERRHPRRVGGALAEGAVDVARARAPARPHLVHHGPLEFAQREAEDLARSPKTEERELRHFHRRAFSARDEMKETASSEQRRKILVGRLEGFEPSIT